MHNKVLIIGTVPYNTKSTSRAFDAYFHFWEKKSVAQFFSDPKTPVKGHCGSFYQVTDYRLLQRWFGRIQEPGIVYSDESLPNENESSEIKDERLSAIRAYRLGAKHTALTHLLRGVLWRKSYWCTPRFNEWLDQFNPECVFLSFSDDFFIPTIACYVAEKYNIPIVSSIGDDYYFNVRFSLNPFYWIYKLSYRALIRKVLSYKGSAIYISDKIKNKYNTAFNLDGETVYLTSNLRRKPFKCIDTTNPLITYFGNIRMGRNHSLDDIGNALGKINRNYMLEVYSGESDPSFYRVLEKNPNIKYGGSIPYELVLQKMSQSDITVIVEGFSKRDINQSRYSLSTKAADALASGATILTYGSSECGIVEYMINTRASFVCTNREELVDVIQQLLFATSLQERYYNQQVIITNTHHNLESSCSIFERIVNHTISK